MKTYVSPSSNSIRDQNPPHDHGVVLKERNTFSLLHFFIFTLCFDVGKKPLARPKHRWEDNIKLYVRETDFGGINWIHLAQDRDQQQVLLNTKMNPRVPHNAGNLLCGCWLLEKDSSLRSWLCFDVKIACFRSLENWLIQANLKATECEGCSSAHTALIFPTTLLSTKWLSFELESIPVT
jgi:hypothetical protein